LSLIFSIAVFIKGVGDAINIVMLAEVARATSSHDRVRAVVISMGARQVGLAVGPALNFIETDVVVSGGWFFLGAANIAALVVALLDLVLEFLLFAFYFDAGAEYEEVNVNIHFSLF
jgi:MFS family permease